MSTQVVVAETSNWSRVVNAAGLISVSLLTNNSFGMANVGLDTFKTPEPSAQTYISSLDSPERNKVKNIGTTPLDARIVQELNKRINENIQTAGGVVSRSLKKSAKTEEATEADKTSKSRLKLLTIKYASKEPNKELLARLEMLNERMLDLAPRVTEEKVFFLEASDSRYHRLLAASNQRKERYEELMKQK